MHPQCLIQSRQNGKFYPVNTEDGEVDLEQGGYMVKQILEDRYELIDQNDRFWIYKLKQKRNWINRLSELFG